LTQIDTSLLPFLTHSLFNPHISFTTKTVELQTVEIKGIKKLAHSCSTTIVVLRGLEEELIQEENASENVQARFVGGSKRKFGLEFICVAEHLTCKAAPHLHDLALYLGSIVEMAEEEKRR
jgi:uncharacterized membrane protein